MVTAGTMPVDSSAGQAAEAATGHRDMQATEDRHGSAEDNAAASVRLRVDAVDAADAAVATPSYSA